MLSYASVGVWRFIYSTRDSTKGNVIIRRGYNYPQDLIVSNFRTMHKLIFYHQPNLQFHGNNYYH